MTAEGEGCALLYAHYFSCHFCEFQLGIICNSSDISSCIYLYIPAEKCGDKNVVVHNMNICLHSTSSTPFGTLGVPCCLLLDKVLILFSKIVDTSTRTLFYWQYSKLRTTLETEIISSFQLFCKKNLLSSRNYRIFSKSRSNRRHNIW